MCSRRESSMKYRRFLFLFIIRNLLRRNLFIIKEPLGTLFIIKGLGTSCGKSCRYSDSAESSGGGERVDGEEGRERGGIEALLT